MNGGPRTPGLVTVIVLCYNHARFVEEALESVRLQAYKAIQLVVIDDCSTDESVDVIRAWIRRTGFPCELHAHQRNMGVVRTINEAYSLARGEFLAGVTADDRWLPQRLERHMSVFATLPANYAVVYSDARIIYEDGSPKAESFMAVHLDARSAPQGDIFQDLLRGNFIPGFCATVRLACYDQVGPYDESLAYEDYDMWLRLASRYRFAFVSGALAEYRLVRNSLSQVLANDPDRRKANALSNFLILEKAAGLRELTEGEGATVRDRLARLAQQVYVNDCAEATAVLRRTLARTRSSRVGLLLVAAALGIRYSTLARVKGILT